MKLLLVGTLVLGMMPWAKAFAGDFNDTEKERYYQVVLIWVKDPDKFQKYGELLGPIVSKYRGAGERIITPVSTFSAGSKADQMEAPHMINIVYYDSKEAYERFERDPDFLKIKHLREESIEMAGIGGEVLGGTLQSGAVSDRLYMIEFAYYADESGKAFEQYEKKTARYYQRHKLMKERVLNPDDVFGGIAMPDLVTIKYLEDEKDRSAMESDAEHATVEKLYGESIRDLIWIEGKAAFVNMD